MKMHALTDFFGPAETVRRPIQCEGITRGPERMTEVAVTCSVNPQIVAPPLGLDRPFSSLPFWKQPMIVY
jgi:hypothetical protein